MDRKTNEQTNEWTDIGGCRVAFATEKILDWSRWEKLRSDDSDIVNYRVDVKLAGASLFYLSCSLQGGALTQPL